MADERAYMGLDRLFDENRQDTGSIGLDVLFAEGPDPDVDDHWSVDFGLRELFSDGTEKRGARRPWTAIRVAWVAAAGAVVAVPLLVWALQGCTRAGCRNTKKLSMG